MTTKDAQREADRILEAMGDAIQQLLCEGTAAENILSGMACAAVEGAVQIHGATAGRKKLLELIDGHYALEAGPRRDA
jgi:hypothetical protein